MCIWGTLLWRHNGHDGLSNHQSRHCLLNRIFRRRSKKTSKLRVTGLCVGNSPVTGEFPAQMASNAENVSIWWRHHVLHVICHHDHKDIEIEASWSSTVIKSYVITNPRFISVHKLLYLPGHWVRSVHIVMWCTASYIVAKPEYITHFKATVSLTAVRMLQRKWTVRYRWMIHSI